MCGLVGITSLKKPVAKQLTSALARLEYRGYDSAGCAFVSEGAFKVSKVLTSVSELSTQVESEKSYCGIAHTRWATHGRAVLANAHPHQSRNQRFALVHNGIIENHQVLRKSVEEEGGAYPWVSSTDSESVVAMVEHFTKQGMDVEEAFSKCLTKIKGAYAFLLLDAHEPGRIYAACFKSPLILSETECGVMLASDPVALSGLTNQYACLPEQVVCVCDAVSVRIGAQDSSCLTWHLLPKDEPTQKKEDKLEGEDSKTYQEIYQQPFVLKRFLDTVVEDERWEVLEACSKRLLTAQDVVIVGCGSSYYAGCVGAHWIQQHLGVMTRAVLGSELRSRHTVLRPNTFYISLSQSGETMDTLLAQRYAKSVATKGLTTLAMCNRAHATLPRESDYALLLEAGVEVGVATTKAFTAQIAAFWALVQTAVRINARVQNTLREDKVYGVEAVRAVQAACSLDEQIAHVAKALDGAQSVYFLGRGLGFPLAQEGALKLKELAYIHAEAYPAAELKHGPLALVSEGFLAVVLVGQDEFIEKTAATVSELCSRGAQVVLIGQDHALKTVALGIDQDFLGQWSGVSTDAVLTQHAWVYFVAVVQQLLAYHAAKSRGLAIDRPRNLAKCVTVE